ncbi:MAG: molybdate ABC transporter substrate-binding protein [Nitrospinae bacterium]|nr:molybdate ABC transporter substrate-binding protein [Nitrospinota bacterium]
MNRSLLAAILSVTALLASTPSARAAQAGPLIAAAADLRFAMEEVAARYKAETGGAVRLSYGSSGNFYTQLTQGAPFELFMSADEEYVFRLADAGLTRDKGTLYAIGRIALFAPHGSALTVDERLNGLRALLGAGKLSRLAIADPSHAPYGRAAREALVHAGVWDGVQSRLVFGENASQAAQFASSGATDGGIIPLSLAMAPTVSRLGSFAALPAGWHAPLRQRMVVMKNAGPAAGAFYRYLQTPAARGIFRAYGFTLPEER